MKKKNGPSDLGIAFSCMLTATDVMGRALKWARSACLNIGGDWVLPMK